MKTIVWLHYDLGLFTDKDGLFQFLDAYKAVECGFGTASFTYEYDNDFTQELKEHLLQFAELKPKDRIYVVFYDDKRKRHVGKFIFGKRMQAPWTGYYTKDEDNTIDLL